MKKIFITILISIFALGIFSFASPVLAAGETEVLFENGNDVPLFNEVNFLPGQTVTRWVKFKNNTADILKAATKISSYTDNDGLGNWLELVIKEGTVELYKDTLKNFSIAGEQMLSDVVGGDQKQYDFSITMKPETGDAMQGKTLNFDIQVGVGSEEAIGGETPSDGTGGGGGYNYQGLKITQEAGSAVVNNIITISWLTNHFATSRVVYDNVSHLTSELGLPPNYGYQWTTLETENSPMVPGHNVSIDFSGWPAGTYYFRPISHGSPEVYGKEIVYLISPAGQATEITPPGEQTGGGVGQGEKTTSPGDLTGEASAAPGAVAGQENETETVVAGQESAQDQEIVVAGGTGAVAGTSTQGSANCPWWVWLLAVILHLWTIGAYSFIIKWQATKKGAQARLPAPDAAGYGGQGELPFSMSFPWLWLSLVVISLAIIYILFLTVCHFPALALGLVFLVYLAVLIARHFMVNKKKQGLWALVPLLMAVGPIAVYVFAGVWAWWLWLLILGLYILSAVFYYNSLSQETNSHAWRRAMLFLTLLVLVLEIAMARHLPGW